MNTLLQLLQLLQLRGIRQRLDTMKAPRPMPEVDCSPEEYITGGIVGPPPRKEESPCARVISDEDMIIRQLEIKFNGPAS